MSCDKNKMIYNRFDLIYGEDEYDILEFMYDNKPYTFKIHKESGILYADCWGKRYPQEVFEGFIETLKGKYDDAAYIDLIRVQNNYKEILRDDIDIILSLDSCMEKMISRLSKTHAHNIRRKSRRIEDVWGEITCEHYRNNVPEIVMGIYFEWKEQTYGVNYGLSANEYIKKYHVTDVMLLKAGGRPFSIILYCVSDEVVYLDNISYDYSLKKYSPGIVGYVEWIRYLIERKCKYVYTGGGTYEYKRYFEPQINKAFTGKIYTTSFVDWLDEYFIKKSIKTVAVYGLGRMGKTFVRNLSHMKTPIIYAVDRTVTTFENINIVSPDEISTKVDLYIVTLINSNEEINKLLNELKVNYMYVYELEKEFVKSFCE